MEVGGCGEKTRDGASRSPVYDQTLSTAGIQTLAGTYGGGRTRTRAAGEASTKWESLHFKMRLIIDSHNVYIVFIAL